MEPPVVPRFLAALEEGGAAATRADAYVTRPGVSAEDIAPEAALMSGGCVDAIVFTSTAEAQGLLSALGGAEDLQALVLGQGAPRPPAPPAFPAQLCHACMHVWTASSAVLPPSDAFGVPLVWHAPRRRPLSGRCLLSGQPEVC